MAKENIDMTYIPADKIQKIVAEANVGCYDTFNKVMEEVGLSRGIPAEDLIDKSAKNVMVNKKELDKAFKMLEVDQEISAASKNHKWIMALVKTMLDKFMEIMLSHESAIVNDLNQKIKRLKERCNILDGRQAGLEERVSQLEEKHGMDKESLQQQIAEINEKLDTFASDMDTESLQQQITEINGKLDTFAGEMTEVKESIVDIYSIIKKIQLKLVCGGMQSHGVDSSQLN